MVHPIFLISFLIRRLGHPSCAVLFWVGAGVGWRSLSISEDRLDPEGDIWWIHPYIRDMVYIISP